MVSQDNFWGEGQAKRADLIAHEGNVAERRRNAAPALPVRNPGFYELESIQNNRVDTNEDTFSNAGTVSDTERKYPDTAGTHTPKCSFEVGDIVEFSYPGSDKGDIQTAVVSGSAPKGTQGTVIGIKPTPAVDIFPASWVVHVADVDSDFTYEASQYDLTKID